MKKLPVLLLLAAAAVVLPARSQYGADPTRWALDAQFGMSRPSIGRNDLTGIYVPGPEAQPGGNVTKLRAEVYLPNTHFAVKAGYEHEQLHILSGDAETDLRQVSLGGRYYPAPWQWYVQPFVGVDGYVNVGDITDHTWMESSEGYRRTIDIRNPRVSLAPVVGADFYLFSHIALQLEYGYRMGLGSEMTANSTYNRYAGEHYVTRTRLHRHALCIGLKLTFPFKFTADDGNSLANGLLDLLFGD